MIPYTRNIIGATATAKIMSTAYGTAFGYDPNNMVAYGISCINKRRKNKRNRTK